MSAFVCPRCESRSTFLVVWRDKRTRPDDPDSINAACQCSNPECKVVLGAIQYAGDAANVTDWWPKHIGGKDFPDVPKHIAAAANETHACMSINAHRAAIGLARAVIEATAKDHKITTGNLETKIDAMAAEGVIGTDTAEAAHAVRLWGNDAAHGDLASEEFTQEDAEEVVALMDEVLNRAYQSPARVKRVIDSRKARKQGQAGGVPGVHDESPL